MGVYRELDLVFVRRKELTHEQLKSELGVCVSRYEKDADTALEFLAPELSEAELERLLMDAVLRQTATGYCLQLLDQIRGTGMHELRFDKWAMLALEVIKNASRRGELAVVRELSKEALDGLDELITDFKTLRATIEDCSNENGPQSTGK